MLSVVIVDSQTLFREGLRAVLGAEPGMCVVGEAEDARSAYAVVEAREPDVVLIAIELCGVDGIAATREILRRLPRTRVVIVSVHDSPEFVRLATAAGADGYVLKDQLASDLVLAIRTVCAGDTYIAPRLAGMRRRKSDSVVSPLAALSPREREVFSLAVRGYSNEGIAIELAISVKTVETHRAHINGKLDVHSSADLVRFAVRHGLAG